MKLAPLALLAPVAFGLVGFLVLACNHPQKRNDWRSPSPPMVCTSDAECRGGTCAIELGATQGTCSGAGAYPGADGGAHPNGPNGPSGPGQSPNLQPSPNDIQL